MGKNSLNQYSRSEERLNIITHGIGLGLSVIGLVMLIPRASEQDSVYYMVSFLVFGGSLILLYAASTFYHAEKNPARRAKLKIADHIAIYFLIAGTYTPFALVTLRESVGWTIFGVVWGMALVGVVFKLFFTGKLSKISTIAYVVMGWVIVFAFKPLAQELAPEGIYWLVAGGILYTIGAVLYSLKKLKYNHAIFHVFVVAGSLAHFVSVYLYV